MSPERIAHAKRATERARTILKPGDWLTVRNCGDSRSRVRMTGWDRDWICSRKRNDIHALHVVKVNGQSVAFDDLSYQAAEATIFGNPRSVPTSFDGMSPLQEALFSIEGFRGALAEVAEAPHDFSPAELREVVAREESKAPRTSSQGYPDVLALIRPKLEEAFNQLDDIMVALSPDAPQAVADTWSKLYDLMTPEFIVARDKRRGIRR